MIRDPIGTMTMTTFDIRALGPGDAAPLRAMLSMFGRAFDDIAPAPVEPAPASR